MFTPKIWTYSLPAALLLMAPFDLLASLGMDVYLPVVPLMPAILETTPVAVQLTLSLYIVVLGFGQLLFGPLSDRMGRRPVLLGGVTLFTAASIALAYTGWAPAFIGLRVVQAAGGAAMLVATFATVRDVYAERPESAVIYGLFGSMLAFVPAVGPVLGALIDQVAGWRGIFMVLAALGALTGMQALLRWPETRPIGEKAQRLHLGAILGNAPFWIYTIGFSAAMGAFFVYFSTAPRLLMERLGLSPTVFSLLFATAALVMIATSRFAGRFVKRWGLRGCLVRGMGLLFGGGVLLALGQLLFFPSVLAFILPMGVISMGIAVTCAVTANGALRPFGGAAGTAVAVYYCLESIIVASAGTLVVLCLPGDTAWPLAAFCIAFALLTIGLSRHLPDE